MPWLHHAIDSGNENVRRCLKLGYWKTCLFFTWNILLRTLTLFKSFKLFQPTTMLYFSMVNFAGVKLVLLDNGNVQKQIFDWLSLLQFAVNPRQRHCVKQSTLLSCRSQSPGRFQLRFVGRVVPLEAEHRPRAVSRRMRLIFTCIATPLGKNGGGFWRVKLVSRRSLCMSLNRLRYLLADRPTLSLEPWAHQQERNYFLLRCLHSSFRCWRVVLALFPDSIHVFFRGAEHAWI